MKRGVKNETQLIASVGAAFRLAYFLSSIALIGIMVCIFLVLPLVALSFVWPPARAIADGVMCRGVAVLMRAQFWLKSRVEIDRVQGCPGVLMVSNHRSHLDVFMLLAQVPGIRVLAKHTLFRIPFLGWMMRAQKQIPVTRGSVLGFTRAMDEIRARLRAGETVHVFPEMTRCPGGLRGTLPFSVAPFHAALQEGALIQPLVIDGTDGYWPRQTRGLRKGALVSIRSLEPVAARDFKTAESLKSFVQERIQGALA